MSRGEWLTLREPARLRGNEYKTGLCGERFQLLSEERERARNAFVLVLISQLFALFLVDIVCLAVLCMVVAFV